jgi:hypothetical protein
MSGNQDTQYVFICSASFSGSTLLDMLIGSHPACESLGELALLPLDLSMNRPCCCGSRIRECAFWSEVARKLDIDTEDNSCRFNMGYLRSRAGNPPLSRLRARIEYGLSYYRYLYNLKVLNDRHSEFDEGIHNTFKIYDTVREFTGKQIVVDSSKHHTRAAALYATRPGSVRIINLVRDGRGVFHSGMNKGYAKKRSLDSWLRHYTHAIPLLEKCVGRRHLLHVRYEDLASHPRRTLAAICQFLSISYDPKMIDFRATVHHNVNGNDMKYASSSEIRINEAWKVHLSKADLQYFERKAGAMNRQLGYE